MVLLFTMCHIVVLVHGVTQLDTRFLRTLRALQAAKHALLTNVALQTLSKVDTNASSSSARPNMRPGSAPSQRKPNVPFACVPVLALIFPHERVAAMLASGAKELDHETALKRWQSGMEAQSRVADPSVSTSSSPSLRPTQSTLFTFDPQRAVFVSASATAHSRAVLQSALSMFEDELDVDLMASRRVVTSSATDSIQPLADFIWRQVDLLRGRGAIATSSAASAAIAAAVGGYRTPRGYLASSRMGADRASLSLTDWLSWLLRLAAGFTPVTSTVTENLDTQDEGESAKVEAACKAAAQQLTCLHPEIHLSEANCRAALPQALAEYEADGPERYPLRVHEEKVKRALTHFMSSARGPAVKKYTDLLRAECERMWQPKRGCEAVSLTGQACTLPVHALPGQSQEEDSVPPRTLCAPHSSGVECLHTCGCGNSRAVRSDPFTIAEAHEGFYSQFKSCACQLGKISCEERIDQGKELTPTDACAWSVCSLGSASVYSPSAGLQQDGFLPGRNLLIQTAIPIPTVKAEPRTSILSPQLARSRESNHTGLAEAVDAQKLDKGVKEPTKLLFGSFEVPLDIEGDQLSKTDMPPVELERKPDVEHVAVHIGYEHECPSGHRYLFKEEELVCTPDDKRDVLARDVPIYRICVGCCSAQAEQQHSKNTDAGSTSEARQLSQLQRIYIVSPTLPKLATKACVKFFLGNSEKESTTGREVVLPPDSLCCVRLPYIYDGSRQEKDTMPRAFLFGGTAVYLPSTKGEVDPAG
eukprot:jgi/Chlat1/3805/Chrsp259S08835